MNCLGYRRSLLAGDGESVQMRGHRLQCAACSEVLREHAAFELELSRALEVPVPAAFEATLANAVVWQRRRFLAAAAISTLTIGTGAYAWLRRDAPLAMACIEFVMMEEAKSIMMGAMPRAEADTALAATLPLARLERIGQLRHIRPCPFNGATSYHVVLAVPQGKVTLLIMPEARVKSKEQAADHGLHASVIALDKGSVGIISSDAGVVNSVAGALRG